MNQPVQPQYPHQPQQPAPSAGLSNIAFASSSSYRVLGELGRGGMGIVYLAEKNCEGVCDYVVLKTIRSLKKDQIERLRQEANIATALRHENIVKTYGLESIPLSMLPPQFLAELGALPRVAPEQIYAQQQAMARPQIVMPRRRGAAGGRISAPAMPVYPHQAYSPQGYAQPMLVPPPPAVGQPDERLYLMAMDYVEGTDLGRMHHDHLQWSLLIPIPLGAFIVSRICRALAYAHEWIVHRDVTPENIMVNNQGVAKLTDFGIAMSAGSDKNEFAGKLQYMAPEQILRGPVDHRSDMFGLGLVAYQILTGISPFAPPRDRPMDAQIDEILARMQSGIIPPHEVLPDVPRALSDIIMTMLEFEPDKRFANMSEAGTKLEGGYLYAEGFGPTNNSLAAYMDIFAREFNNYDQNLLKQLGFLKDRQTKKIVLHRPVKFADYTPAAREVIRNTQKGYPIFRALATKQA